MTAEFEATRVEIADAAKRYKDSMGFLMADMIGRTLNHLEKQNRESLLNWIWGGNYWERHRYFQKTRVEGTGTWLLNSHWYKEWRDDLTATPILICLGMRISIQ